MNNSIVIKFRAKYKCIVNYSYLVVDIITRDAVLIDCVYEYDDIVRYIDSKNINLRKIFLTHAHFDHVASVEQMVERYDVDVYMSLDEIEYYQYRCSNLLVLKDFQTINISGISIKSFITPGHTIGSTCFEIGNNFFSGDTVFYEGCGICWGDGASAEMMYESFQKIKTFIPTSHLLYSAHSFGKIPGSIMGDVYRNNIYFNLKDKASFVNLRMRYNQKNTIIKYY